MAAKPQGEEKRSAPSRGITPARIAAIGALAVVVIVLAIVLFSGGGGHKYTFLFQNAGQLVNDNQVMVGGSPVGTVSSIELSPENLAEVNVEVEQELHEGTTAVIRATSLSGVANHYVSISPGPNSSPALEEGADAGARLDHDAGRHRPALQQLPAEGARRAAELHQGQRADLRGTRQGSERKLQILRHGAEPGDRLRLRTERRRTAALQLPGQLEQADHARWPARAEQLSSAIHNANTAFKSISSQNVALDQSAAGAAAGPAPVEHHLRQPAGGARRRRTAGQHGEAGDQEPRPVPRRTAPGAQQVHPLHPEPRRWRSTARARTTTRPNCWRRCPSVQQLASSTFPHAEDAIAAFQPQLNFARSYTPDLFNALGQPRRGGGRLRRQRQLRARPRSPPPEPLQVRSAASSKPITRAEQFNGFTSTSTPRRCPGGATQPAADNSNPYVNPPHGGSSVNPSECDPTKGSGG